MAGLPVDQVEAPAVIPPTVVVAKILDARPHPNADRLRVCRVDAGGGELTIVCGAPNARTGLYSPLATIGTTLPNGLTVKEAKIRGEKSQGMLCAEGDWGRNTTASSSSHRPHPGLRWRRSWGKVTPSSRSTSPPIAAIA